MKNIVQIALNDLRVYFSDRSNWVSLLGLPLILTFVLGLALGGTGSGNTVTRLPVDLIDQDMSTASQQLISDLTANNPSFYFCPSDDSPTSDCGLGDDKTLTVEHAKERVQNKDTQALIVIPKGFGATLTASQPVQLQYASLANVTTGDPILSGIQATIQQWNTALVASQVAVHIGETYPNGSIFADATDQQAFAQAVYDKAQNYQDARPLTIAYSLTAVAQTANSIPQGFGQSVPGMGSMFVMFTVFGCIIILIKERKQWTLQRLVVLPLHRSQILGGKVLFYFTLGMVQYVVVFSIALVTGTRLGNDPIALVLLMMAFTFCCTGLALCLATLIKTQQQADGVTLLLAMTLAPLGGAWWPLEIVPSFMQLIGRLSPVSWAMEGYRSLIYTHGNLSTIATDILVLVIAGLVLFAIGVRGFEYE